MSRITPRKVRFRPPHQTTPPADTTEALRGSYKTPEPVNSTCRHNASLPRFPYAPGTRQQVVLLLSAPAQNGLKTASKAAIRPHLQPNIIPLSPGPSSRSQNPNFHPLRDPEIRPHPHAFPEEKTATNVENNTGHPLLRPHSAIHPSFHQAPQPTTPDPEKHLRGPWTRIQPNQNHPGKTPDLTPQGLDQAPPLPCRSIPGHLPSIHPSKPTRNPRTPSQSGKITSPQPQPCIAVQPQTSAKIPGIPPRK